MPILPPPPKYRGTPAMRSMPAGIELWRVHRVVHPANEFRKNAAHPYFGPGRFDAMPPDVFPFWYAAETVTTALAEVLMRDLTSNEYGEFMMPREHVAGRVLTRLVTTRELHLVSLESEPDLRAVAQDARLVNVSGHEQAWSRYWVQWLRPLVPHAHGLIWVSNRDRPDSSLVLFGDRCDQAWIQPAADTPIRLDTPTGIDWVNNQMWPRYQTLVEPLGP